MTLFIQIIMLVIEVLKMLFNIALMGGTPPYTKDQVQAAALLARKTGDLTELRAMRFECAAAYKKLVP